MTFAGISRNNWPDWTGWQLIDAGETHGPRIEAMVHAFFKIHFWDVVHGDRIGFQGVADAIYDFAVNSGLSPAVKRVQKIVGSKQDGIFGPKTFSKLNAYVVDEKTEAVFVAKYNLLRVFRFKDICMADNRKCYDRVSSNLQFLCGWINRVERSM